MGLKNIKVIARVKIKQIAASEMVDMRLISFYLGLKIHKNCEKKNN